MSQQPIVRPSPDELQRLVDRAAIHDVLARYYHDADSGNAAVVRSCFTEDVNAHYDGRPRYERPAARRRACVTPLQGRESPL